LHTRVTEVAGEELEELEAVEDAIITPLELELPVTDTETNVHGVDGVDHSVHEIVCADAGAAVRTAGANARPPTATAEPASVTIRVRRLIRPSLSRRTAYLRKCRR
jgi:hypothetical protein